MLFDKELMHGLDIPKVLDLIEYYEACSTAEYILDNLDNICESAALEIAYEVRRRMRDAQVCSGDDEVGYIIEVIQEWKDAGYALS